MRILFLGSDDFSTSILKTILRFPKLKVDVLGPLVENTKCSNKPVRTLVVPKIVEYSNKNNINCSQDINTYKASITNGKYDMLITASYSAFIHKSVINKFPQTDASTYILLYCPITRVQLLFREHCWIM